MLNKKINLKELILLVALILFAAYYFLFLTPLSKTLDEIEAKQMEVDSQLDVTEMKVLELNNMKRELEEMEAEGLTPEPMPVYNNIDRVLLELNTIMSGTTNYNISFEDAVSDGIIARRTIQISFTTSSMEAAIAKVNEVEEGQNRYLITEFNIAESGSSTNEVIVALGGGQKYVTTSMVVICFEFVSPDGDPLAVEMTEEEKQALLDEAGANDDSYSF